MAATYASRLTSAVFAPVMATARRWSQSSASRDDIRAATSTTDPSLSSTFIDPAAVSDDTSSSSDAQDPSPVLTPVLSSSILEETHESEHPTAAPSSSSTAAEVASAAAPPLISESNPTTTASTTDPTIPSSTDSSIEAPDPPIVPPSDNDAPAAAAPSPAPPRSTALPEDDGQRQLRNRLTEITHLDLPERERARRMHDLMTERWQSSQASKTAQSEGGGSETSPKPLPATLDNPYKLQPGDDQPTYYCGPNPSEEEGVRELGCSHYRRNVRLQCSTCERWYTCRFCHDEAEDHVLVRQQTKNMLCMPCGKPQPAGQDCKFCGKRSAKYYCDKCKLWDDDPHKSIYHCNDCGICRIGHGLGKDFFHCKRCGVCMSIKLENSHRCIERSTECDCPICGEFMFTSTLTVVFMTCGHSIHHKCYYEHMKTSYRCPTCARTIINMESQFRALDVEIANQPLPEPYRRWKAHVSCNDCSVKSTVPFHFLGLKCANCYSYNTSQIRVIRPEDVIDGGVGGGAEGVPGTALTESGDTTTPTGDGVQTPYRPGSGTNLSVPPAVLALSGLGGGLAPEEHGADTPAGGVGIPEIEAGNHQRNSMPVGSFASSIEVATGPPGLMHGDEDLFVDNGGWVTDEPDEEEEECDSYSEDEEEEDDDDDDDDGGELIQLIGHL